MPEEILGPKDAYIRTVSGKKFYPLNPKPEDVDIIDIAHALSNKCRFTGHTSSFYSIAQHCYLVSNLLADVDAPLEVQLQGLLHDASEAYLPDVASPIKRYIAGFHQIEANVEHAIALSFGLPLTFDARVKEADRMALFIEASLFIEGDVHTKPTKAEQERLTTAMRRPRSWEPARAKWMFMHRFDELTYR
jgi:5'-deoxynucleotidase YfbR-like HD superfamily hydrolase